MLFHMYVDLYADVVLSDFKQYTLHHIYVILPLSHICYIINTYRGDVLFEIIYYTKNDDCPIFDFLKTLPKKDRAKILREIEMLQEFGLSLGMPHIKKMKNDDDMFGNFFNMKRIGDDNFKNMIKYVILIKQYFYIV